MFAPLHTSCLLRRQRKGKTEKAKDGKKCRLNHEVIHNQKGASASEIFIISTTINTNRHESRTDVGKRKASALF